MDTSQRGYLRLKDVCLYCVEGPILYTICLSFPFLLSINLILIINMYDRWYTIIKYTHFQFENNLLWMPSLLQLSFLPYIEPEVQLSSLFQGFHVETTNGINITFNSRKQICCPAVNSLYACYSKPLFYFASYECSEKGRVDE